VTSFLEYCFLHWGAHAKRDLSDSARSLAVALFREYDNHVSLKLVMMEHVGLEFRHFRNDYWDSPFSGLNCASFFGISDLVSALIKMECYDINRGFSGHTPLTWASRNGHAEVVKILLDRKEVHPDKPSELGCAPLSWAAACGHEGVVKILLREEEVNPNKPDNDGRTPLLLAAEDGHAGVVKILLGQKEVDPYKSDHTGRTPVAYAV